VRRLIVGLVLGAVVAFGSGCQVPAGVAGRYAKDPVIRHWVKRRAELLAERRQLVRALGKDHPAVADLDRQIRFVDRLIDSRQAELAAQAAAREYLQTLKAEADRTSPPGQEQR